MFSNHEKFKNIAAGFQSIVIGFGVVSAALWAILVLQEGQKAQIDLDNARLQTETGLASLNKLRFESERLAVLDVTITTNVESVEGYGERSLFAEVSIANTGSQHTSIAWPGSLDFDNRIGFPLVVSKVTVSDGTEVRDRVASKSPIFLGVSLIRAGAVARYSFFIPLQDPGLYYVSFKVAVSKEEAELGQQYGLGEQQVWAANSYVYVD